MLLRNDGDGFTGLNDFGIGGDEDFFTIMCAGEDIRFGALPDLDVAFYQNYCGNIMMVIALSIL